MTASEAYLAINRRMVRPAFPTKRAIKTNTVDGIIRSAWTDGTFAVDHCWSEDDGNVTIRYRPEELIFAD